VDFGTYFFTIVSTFRMARRSGHVAKWFLGDQNKSPVVRTGHIEFVYPENVGFIEQAAEQYAQLSNLTVEYLIQDRLLQQSMANARHVPHAVENAGQPS
jgi:hypothetical protein